MNELQYIKINEENINQEHLCCAIGDPKHQDGVKNKKEWIKERIKEGHVFYKLNAQGKVFIEYAPLNTAWCSVTTSNKQFESEYLYIYCLWVAGSFKGNGYGKALLEYAINDAILQGKKGLCTLSSKKKKPFLGEYSFFEKFGFKIKDKIIMGKDEFYLLVLNFGDDYDPKFTEEAKTMKTNTLCPTIYYSPECPYTNNSINELIKYTSDNNIESKFIKITSAQEAKKVPCIFNNWANFINGDFVSNTILNTNSFLKLIGK